MAKEHDYFTYILASRSRQLYVGMTNSMMIRHKQHLEADVSTHVGKYRIHRVVYFEHTQYVLNAIAREKELKRWSHDEKIALIESINPTWEDLSEDWGQSLRRFWQEEAKGGRRPVTIKGKADPLRG